MTTTTKRAPAAAFEFLTQPQIGKVTEADGVTRAPIRLVASSGVAFENAYWGRVVFDLSGIRAPKGRLILDYCHLTDEVIGFGTPDIANDGLSIAGELVATSPDDRALEVMRKGAAGVPYEASIKIDPYNGLAIEEFGAGTTATVNGQQFEGPITVIRQCLLRGVAVCPYGSDPLTRSEFAAGERSTIEVSVTTHKEKPVTTDPKTQPAERATEFTADQIKEQLRSGHEDYVARFGSEFAAKWGPLGESRPLVDCYADFVAKLREDHAAELQSREEKHAAAIAEFTANREAITKQRDELQQRIDAAKLGEETHVEFSPAEGDQKKIPTEFSQALTPGLAQFAAAIRSQRTAAHN